MPRISGDIRASSVWSDSHADGFILVSQQDGGSLGVGSGVDDVSKNGSDEWPKGPTNRINVTPVGANGQVCGVGIGSVDGGHDAIRGAIDCPDLVTGTARHIDTT